MKYDPVKSKIGNLVNRRLWMRKLFYRLLDILLLRAWHVKRLIRSLNNSGMDNANILDAGSGFGQYTWSMWRINRSWTIHGVDLKQEQIDDCNSFFNKTKAADNVSFALEDLSAYTQTDMYDLILSVDVMEHIEDDNAVFRNFHTSLRDRGCLLISTPSDRGGSDVHHDHDESFIEEHVRDGYGKEEISGKLRNAGFSEISVRYTYGRPGQLSWKLSMKYPILMLNASWLFAIVLPLWYLIVMPLALILNVIDVRKEHHEGSGLLVTAKKSTT